VGRWSALTTNVKVEVSAQFAIVGIDVLEPAVKELVQVIKVVLAAAARRVACSGGFSIGQPGIPAVVLANASQDVSIVTCQGLGEETSAGADVEARVTAVATWSSATFLLCDLHETLFTASANSVGVAAALLHGEGCQEDCGHSKFATILLEHADKSRACFEGTVGIFERVAQIRCDEIGNVDVCWSPATTIVDTTVQPIETTVRPSSTSGCRSSPRITAARRYMCNDAARPSTASTATIASAIVGR